MVLLSAWWKLKACVKFLCVFAIAPAVPVYLHAFYNVLSSSAILLPMNNTVFTLPAVQRMQVILPAETEGAKIIGAAIFSGGPVRKNCNHSLLRDWVLQLSRIVDIEVGSRRHGCEGDNMLCYKHSVQAVFE